MKNLMKAAMIGLFCLTTPAMANDAEEKAVLDVINTLFDGMREGNAEKIKALVLPDTKLDRITPGKPIHRGQLSDWVNNVATLKPGQADEQVYDVAIHIEGPLATAWTPFTLAINGEMRSCGVNQFTLVKQDGGWKVAYLIDTHTPEKCKK